jgi:hypothetical protein
VGKVASIHGTVQVEREGRSQTAKEGDRVYLLDRWRTQPESGVELVFLDDSRVKLAPNTVLEITEYVYKPEEKTRQSLVSMVSGKARFLVQDFQDYKERRFRVQTQTAIVGTRDTDFIVNVKAKPEINDVCKDLAIEAFCIENAIVIHTRNLEEKHVVITANMLSQVCGMNPPTPPRFVTAVERQRLLRGLEQVGAKREGLGSVQQGSEDKTEKIEKVDKTAEAESGQSPQSAVTIGDAAPGSSIPPSLAPPNVGVLDGGWGVNLPPATIRPITPHPTPRPPGPPDLPPPPPPPGNR